MRTLLAILHHQNHDRNSNNGRVYLGMMSLPYVRCYHDHQSHVYNSCVMPVKTQIECSMSIPPSKDHYNPFRLNQNLPPVYHLGCHKHRKHLLHHHHSAMINAVGHINTSVVAGSLALPSASWNLRTSHAVLVGNDLGYDLCDWWQLMFCSWLVVTEWLLYGWVMMNLW